MMGLGKGNGTLLKWQFLVSIRSISGVQHVEARSHLSENWKM